MSSSTIKQKERRILEFYINKNLISLIRFVKLINKIKWNVIIDVYPIFHLIAHIVLWLIKSLCGKSSHYLESIVSVKEKGFLENVENLLGQRKIWFAIILFQVVVVIIARISFSSSLLFFALLLLLFLFKRVT